ncbi:hypothetical protein MHK_006581 [Candidatus Magnetomorum sp. HK-1]|nr:hypothetical protein MHK_006581 [Candidatus Magnetomorum sp. HK-1]
MKFKDLVESIPFWKIAEKSDNHNILKLYNSLHMEGGSFNIRFVKNPDYFKFNTYESPNSYVIIAVNKENEVEGMFSLLIRACYLDGKQEYVGHISDLRMKRKKHRKADFSWYDIFRALFQKGIEIDEIKHCKYFLGSYVVNNHYAIRAIKEKAPWEIHDVANYCMVSILGRRPCKYFGCSSSVESGLKVSISRAIKEDIPELTKFLDQQNKKRTFGFVFSGADNELDRRFKDWDNFSISNFYIAKDDSGKIIACTAYWNPTKGRRIVVDRFPFYLDLLGKILKIFGKDIPNKGQELKILYLTHVELCHLLSKENKRILLNKFIDYIYASGLMSNYHIMGFCDYTSENLSIGMEKNYFLEKTYTSLYQFYDLESKNVLKIKEDDQDVRIGHEMVLT